MPLRAPHLKEIEGRFQEGSSERVLEPHQEGYGELRDALIAAAESPEELAEITALYPSRQQVEDEERAQDEAKNPTPPTEREKAIAAANSREELARAMAAHPVSGAQGKSQRERERDREIAKAGSVQEINDVMRKYAEADQEMSA